MYQPPIRIYFTIAIFLIILLFVVILLPAKKENTIKNGIPSSFPFPTLLQPNLAGQQSLPHIFTGVKNEAIPQELVDKSMQERALKKTLPVEEKQFFIAFDYTNDMFVVTLGEPKTQSKTAFVQWLKENYPLIPVERISFQ